MIRESKRARPVTMDHVVGTALTLFDMVEVMKIDKLGRPTIGFSHVNARGLNAGKKQVKQFNDFLSISISKEDRQALRARAKARGVTVAELTRTYITWGLENDDVP